MNLKLENIFADTSRGNLFLIRVCFFSSLVVFIGIILSSNFEYLQIGSCHFFWNKSGSENYPVPPIDFFDFFYATLFYPLPFVLSNTKIISKFIENRHKRFKEYDLLPRLSLSAKILISAIFIICWGIPIYLLTNTTKITVACI